MWLILIRPYSDVCTGPQYLVSGRDASMDLLPWIGMKAADNCFVPWLASQTDILAEDWELL